MSTGHIYILTDGSNTKIGITTSFDTRMASYKTHNATASLYKQYQCPIDEAKRIESTIKSVFKANITGQGKEWFAVPAETIDRYVSNLLEKPNQPAITPSMHGVRLTEKADCLLDEITKLLNHPNIEERRKAEAKKEEMAETFATAFGLGIPRHKLPDSSQIVIRQGLAVDMAYCADPYESDRVRNGVKKGLVSIPYDDHGYPSYHLVRLDTGHYVAICTAYLSMPYLPAIDKPEKVREMVNAANEIGWFCTMHQQWSWHSPQNTGLVLYQPKTPAVNIVNAWNGSFRKWVIERQELLKLEPYAEPGDLEKRIEDIAWDKTFPMDVQSFEELCERYLDVYWHIRPGLEDNGWMEEPFRLLFEKWQRER